jgi:RNA polymerase sigma-70 factor (ECF subfamily)
MLDPSKEGMLRVTGSHDEADRSALRRFEALFHQHADAVLAYAIRRSDSDTAEEIVAETFAVAWRRLDVVPDPALPWLLGVARKVLANERRSQGRAVALALRLVREPVESTDDPADVIGARISMQAALDGLLPAEREVLQLLAWEGLSAAQAADTLGCSRVAITLRLHRARRRFHRLLDEPLDAETLSTGPPVARRQIDQIARASRMKEADDAS